MSISDRDAARLNMSMPVANDIKLGDIIKELQDNTGGASDLAAGDISATPIAPGTADNVQGILEELAARIAALEAG